MSMLRPDISQPQFGEMDKNDKEYLWHKNK
jgi:hypothetical protein